MNWPSYLEDIEEMRHQNEHFRRGMTALVGALRDDASLPTIHRVERDYRTLADQLAKKYETLVAEAQKKFDAAVKYLRDPAVHVTDRMTKLIRERDELRARVQKVEAELVACRKSQSKSFSNLTKLGKEKSQLEARLKEFEDRSALDAALAGVRPLKR
jgi:chromosome segregation ATPase